MIYNTFSPEIVLTQDGSVSLFVPEIKEQYHSRFGAITESMHIYIGCGLHQIHSGDILIFEFGFGTGLNALLTLTEADRLQLNVNYVAIELNPLPLSLIAQLDYASRIESADPDILMKMHESEWGKETALSVHFVLKKLHQDFRIYAFDRKYDLIYFDAFAPMVQPEVWTQEIFSKIAEAMNPGALLITYSAKGEIRRRLATAGLKVKRLPGPPGKREILQAHKP